MIILYGEQATEDNYAVWQTLALNQYREYWTMKDGKQVFESWEIKSFRYVELNNCPVEITADMVIFSRQRRATDIFIRNSCLSIYRMDSLLPSRAEQRSTASIQLIFGDSRFATRTVSASHGTGLISIVSGNLAHVFEDASVSESDYNLAAEELVNRILAHIDDYGFIWGWGQGGKNELASLAALHGIELVCANMSNSSFLAVLPIDPTDFTQLNRTDQTAVILQNNAYVSFMMNEGDTYKAMANLYGGSWNQSARGDFPSAWGIDPLVWDKFSLFADYCFGRSATNDYLDVFEGIKQRVAEGRWEPNGDFYVEVDCNIIGGEMLISQFIKGKRFVMAKFGYTADIF